ncbi:MAG: winged helix-turn-helix transcriptional regulator [Candidatus Omnitrophica bacterium]|nr:winged helix-turn-helix transcriptional regulator [Candidatus Omnitrophota bacterium]
MTLKRLRQILKALAEDTRLRILNLLYARELTVGDMCKILRVSQPTLSKHLARLRLLRIVIDRRKGNLVYYSLNRATQSDYEKILGSFLAGFRDIEILKKDITKLESSLH